MQRTMQIVGEKKWRETSFIEIYCPVWRINKGKTYSDNWMHKDIAGAFLSVSQE